MIVIDASATGALLLQDHDSDFINAVEDAISTSVVYAPCHWPVEVMNLLVKATRQGRQLDTDLSRLWQQASAFIATGIVEPVKVDADLLDLSRRETLAPRDASYVELAVRRRLTMCTADSAMVRACRSLSIPLIAPAA